MKPRMMSGWSIVAPKYQIEHSSHWFRWFTHILKPADFPVRKLSFPEGTWRTRQPSQAELKKILRLEPLWVHAVVAERDTSKWIKMGDTVVGTTWYRFSNLCQYYIILWILAVTSCTYIIYSHITPNVWYVLLEQTDEHQTYHTCFPTNPIPAILIYILNTT